MHQPWICIMGCTIIAFSLLAGKTSINGSFDVRDRCRGQGRYHDMETSYTQGNKHGRSSEVICGIFSASDVFMHFHIPRVRSTDSAF